jgi:hypothetical protein
VDAIEIGALSLDPIGGHMQDVRWRCGKSVLLSEVTVAPALDEDTHRRGSSLVQSLLDQFDLRICARRPAAPMAEVAVADARMDQSNCMGRLLAAREINVTHDGAGLIEFPERPDPSPAAQLGDCLAEEADGR